MPSDQIALVSHLDSFNEIWIQRTQNREFQTIRRNAVAYARSYEEKLLSSPEKTDFFEELLSHASSMQSYRGALCGEVVCIRLRLMMLVVIQEILLRDNSPEARERILSVNDKVACPELLEILNDTPIL